MTFRSVGCDFELHIRQTWNDRSVTKGLRGYNVTPDLIRGLLEMKCSGDYIASKDSGSRPE